MLTLDGFFSAIGNDLARAREERRRTDRTEASRFNVFSCLAPDENCLSDIFADLLSPDGSHSQGALFIEQFLRVANIDLGASNDLGKARLRREDRTDFLRRNRRIDFTVEVGPFAIGVENKPWANDQPDQVADYLKHLAGKYGPDRAFLVYLSGGGGPPQSLPAAQRLLLEREGRLRALPYAGDIGVSGWLLACREACRSAKVRWFLDDLIGYIDWQFGSGNPLGGKDEMETDIFVRHALRDEESLALFLAASKAFDAVAGRIISAFTSALVERLQSELGAGWRIQADAPWEKVAVSKQGWPGSLRVVLAHDKEMPCEVYFTVRQTYQAPVDSLADRIAEALTARCGSGKRDGSWWPYWYRYERTHTQWASHEVLVELWRKGDGLNFFVSRLTQMAQAVDAALASIE